MTEGPGPTAAAGVAGASDRARTAAQCLRIDVATVEAVTAMRDAGLRPILLKGPAVVDLLYRDDPTARGYLDVDLLVPPEGWQRARDVLAGLGYRRYEVEARRPELMDASPLSSRLRQARSRHAEAWARHVDRLVVDLHRTVHGAEPLDEQAVCDAILADAETIDVLGTPIEVPSRAVRLLHVVLHLSRKDEPGTRAWIDLERAIATMSDREWDAAAAAARAVGLDPVMGPLLRIVPAGQPIADRLGLPVHWPAHLIRENSRASESSRFLAQIRDLPWSERWRVVVDKVLPRPAYLRAHSELARRGPGGLALTYLYRVALIPWRLAEGVAGFVRHRRGHVVAPSAVGTSSGPGTVTAAAPGPDEARGSAPILSDRD